MPEFNQLWTYGPTVVLLGMILVFLLKFAPTWKEVRLRELDLRAGESEAKVAQSAALTTLGESLKGLSNVLQSVAVEQRRATEMIEILQRANADSTDHLINQVRQVGERVGKIEDNGGSTLGQVAVDLYKINERLGNLEKHVEPERSATGA